jgi:hypothetical protein
MPEISRRFFIFGSAATLAAAALPEIAPAVPPEQIYTAVTSSPARGLRRVHEIWFMAANKGRACNTNVELDDFSIDEDDEDDDFDFPVLDNGFGAITVTVSRHPNSYGPFFDVSADARTNVCWKAASESPLLFPEGSLMVVEATGVPCEVKVYGDDADGSFLETYNFPSAVHHVERWAIN